MRDLETECIQGHIGQFSQPTWQVVLYRQVACAVGVYMLCHAVHAPMGQLIAEAVWFVVVSFCTGVANDFPVFSGSTP